MASSTRKLNLNVGINTTGYLFNAWKYWSGSRHDINDPQYYRRLTELAHNGSSVYPSYGLPGECHGMEGELAAL